MLNNDALNQLEQLKKDIQASKDYSTGTVVGSNGRFGFVKLADGRDAYLSPQKMQRVIPGDVVYVSLIRNAKNKLEADLEKLTSPALDRFVGQYRIKGSAHFVQPSGPQASRWIFVPPKARGNCTDGDYVVAKLLNHPFKDTRASAKILDKIGQQGDTKFELKFIRTKYEFNPPDSKSVDQQVEIIEKQFIHEAFGERADLCHLPFVTIDATSTKDMDDALAIESIGEELMRLHVAVADPASFIARHSPLDGASFARGQTTYLLGGLVPMLPVSLSHHCFSIEPGKKRPALVCHLDIDSSGDIVNTEFEYAVVESKHKLSYEEVAGFLTGKSDSVPEAIRPMLKLLLEFSTRRRSFRERHYLVAQDQNDYDYQLDERGRIASIELRPRTLAHQIVEEAMLATNISGAKLLERHGVGLCVSHRGFRQERLGEVKALLKEENIEHGELNSLAEYVKLFRHLESDEKTHNLIAPLKRMTDNIQLSPTFSPHLGMGLPAYATITSPIRRYADLYNHWAMQTILAGKSFSRLDDSGLEKLNAALQQSRQADRELTQWLVTQYAKNLLGRSACGKIRIVTQHGFGVRLDDNGIEGFVAFPKDKEKKYDAKRMQLHVDSEVFYLGQSVDITIKSTDIDKRRIAFDLARAGAE